MSARFARIPGIAQAFLFLGLSVSVVLLCTGAGHPVPAGATPKPSDGAHASATADAAARRAGAIAEASRPAGSSRPALTLVSQSRVVSGAEPFTLEVQTSVSAPPAGQLALDVSIYSCLSSRSSFQQTVSGSSPATTRLGSTGALPLTSLATAGHNGEPRYRITVGLAESTTATPSGFNGSLIGLQQCTPQSYVGVYPVAVALENRSSSKVVSHFTTFFTYTQGSAGRRLRVALVLPVAAPAQPSAGTSAGAPAALTPGELGRLSGTVAALSHSPVPATVEASPQTLQRLDASGSSGAATVAELSLLSAQQSTHEILAAPYVPVSPGNLAASGLGKELARQLQRGAQVLSDLHLAWTPGVWVAGRPVGAGAAAAISTMATHQLVLPPSSLVPVTQELTPSNTFSLLLGHGQQVDAATVDPELTRQFTAHPSDPVLAAYQLLADLDLTDMEQPSNLRGVVVAPPAGWQPDAVLIGTLLQGLAPAADPNLQPVTVSNFFAQVPQGTYVDGNPSTRELANQGTPSSLPASFVAAVHQGRGRWNAFASATQGAGHVLNRLDDALLTSETSGLGAHGRSRALAGFDHALSAQLSQIQLSTDRTITLTSRTATLPLTILSSAPYRVTGELSLSSDKLEFPSGAVRPITIDRSTTPVRMQVVARTSGDLPVTVNVMSPVGGLVLVHGRLTVRSTATSVVGIVLTVVALMVLAGWWFRSSITRRRARATGRRA